VTLRWSKIGRTNPLHIAHDGRVFATVQRGDGGKWTGTLTLRIDAGDPTKAKAKIAALFVRLDADHV
jgi:hypothetical protein